jgi:hypothetical protein
MSLPNGLPDDGSSTSRDLPPYRAVLVVDARRFSDNSSAHQTLLNARIVQVLEAAFIRAGLGDAWEGRRFSGHTGDGYIAGLPPETLPHVLHPFLRELQAELRERDRRRGGWEPRLRLRASVHLGPLPDNGVGAPMTETHRLLDSDQVRQALNESHEEVTFLAVILSQRVYQDVIEGGYTALHPAQFTEVEATAKRFAERAYLYVPEPSVSARLPDQAVSPAERPPTSGPPRPNGDDRGGVRIKGKNVGIAGDVAGRDIHRTTG